MPRKTIINIYVDPADLAEIEKRTDNTSEWVREAIQQRLEREGEPVNTQELSKIRQWVAHVAGVQVCDVELVHGVNQSSRDVPEFVDIYTGDLAEYQERARAQLRAAGIRTEVDHSTLHALTYEVSAAWRRHQGAVLLYEDNAGGLYIVHGVYGWSDLEQVPDAQFAEDAAAAAVIGGTDDWTVAVMSPADIAEVEQSATLIATYADGQINILRDEHSGMCLAGHAGRQYLGLQKED